MDTKMERRIWMLKRADKSSSDEVAEKYLKMLYGSSDNNPWRSSNSDNNKPKNNVGSLTTRCKKNAPAVNLMEYEIYRTRLMRHIKNN